MRPIVLAALLAAAASPAYAGSFCPRDWYHSAQAMVRSLIGAKPAVDREVIVPPADIDAKMALVPPAPRGTMRIIPPSGKPARP